jgi:tyrosyl-tRNA synthetase
MPLLEGLDGVEKMSKSKNNYIGITEVGNTMFAKIMSISDDMMWKYYDLLSFRSIADLAALKAEVDGGATRATPKWHWRRKSSRFHSQDAAEHALADFVNRSKGGIPTISPKSACRAPHPASAIAESGRLCASLGSHAA